MADNRRPGQKSYEFRTPRDMRYAGRPADSDLAEELLKLIAIGVTVGVATITGAKKLGEGLQNLQEESARKLEAQRKAYREAVRAAANNEFEYEYETLAAEQPSEELIMSPSPLEEQPAEVSLVMEGSIEPDLDEIRFDGQEDAQSRFEDAMSEYDNAMDEAAGIK